MLSPSNITCSYIHTNVKSYIISDSKFLANNTKIALRAQFSTCLLSISLASWLFYCLADRWKLQWRYKIVNSKWNITRMSSWKMFWLKNNNMFWLKKKNVNSGKKEIKVRKPFCCGKCCLIICNSLLFEIWQGGAILTLR